MSSEVLANTSSGNGPIGIPEAMVTYHLNPQNWTWVYSWIWNQNAMIIIQGNVNVLSLVNFLQNTHNVEYLSDAMWDLWDWSSNLLFLYSSIRSAWCVCLGRSVSGNHKSPWMHFSRAGRAEWINLQTNQATDLLSQSQIICTQRHNLNT